MPVVGPSGSGTLVGPGHRGANKDRGSESLSGRDTGLHCVSMPELNATEVKQIHLPQEQPTKLSDMS